MNPILPTFIYTMKYNKSNITGDAGEHLVCYKIIKYFGFPCRKIGIDLGIDVEIEIINSELCSTGEFIKCQVKTTSSNSMNLTLTKKHLTCWKSIQLPVIVFLVHLKEERIYWKYLDPYEINLDAAESRTITFIAKDELISNQKAFFSSIPLFPTISTIKQLYKECFKFSEVTSDILNGENWDITTFESIVYDSHRIIEKLEEIQRLITRNSPKITPILKTVIDSKSKGQLSSLFYTIERYHKKNITDYGDWNPEFKGIDHLDAGLLFR